MTPEEHAAMVATRARFIANGEPWRVPRVGTQTSADGTGDVPSYRDVPQPAHEHAPTRCPAPHPYTECPERMRGIAPRCECGHTPRHACHAPTVQPERLTLWDQPIELWSPDR